MIVVVVVVVILIMLMMTEDDDDQKGQFIQVTSLNIHINDLPYYLLGQQMKQKSSGWSV